MIKIKLIKEWENFPGHIIAKGKTVEVSNSKAIELISEDYAKAPGAQTMLKPQKTRKKSIKNSPKNQ